MVQISGKRAYQMKIFEVLRLLYYRCWLRNSESLGISRRFPRIFCLPRFFRLFRLTILREVRYTEGVREQGAEDNLW